MKLPEPTETAEDRFVARWRDEGESTASLIEATQRAVAQGRPQLASRLAQLLDARSDGEAPPQLNAALRANRLRLIPNVEIDQEADEDAARAHQASRKERFRSRQRTSLSTPRGIAGEGTRGNGKGRGPRRR